MLGNEARRRRLASERSASSPADRFSHRGHFRRILQTHGKLELRICRGYQPDSKGIKVDEESRDEESADDRGIKLELEFL